MYRFVWVLMVVVSLGEAQRFKGFQPFSNSVDCQCQCSTLELTDNLGRVSGNCKSSWKGARWCYIDSWQKPCGDLKASSRSTKPWSYKGCRIKSSRKCQVRNPIIQRPIKPRPPVSQPQPQPQPQTDFNDDKEIPFTELKCRSDEEHLPDDPFCC